MQQFDPAGVGARDLKECLLLQLRRQEERNALAEVIVEKYMEKLANRKWHDLAKLLSVALIDIQEAFDYIQLLDPRPGTQYLAEPTHFVIPEIRIVLVEGEIIVQVVDDLFPQISVNDHYKQLLLTGQDQKAKKYAKQKIQQAQWLINSINQRKNTILKVGEAIARHQSDYLSSKNGVLKPLTLQEIAAEVDLHESTVSRATANKYAETPRGVLELKSLFSTAIENESGQTTSSQSIKRLIQFIINEENKQKPLSDAKIVKLLEEKHDIVISRRAIAKYRDELGILPSPKRKRYEE